MKNEELDARLIGLTEGLIGHKNRSDWYGDYGDDYDAAYTDGQKARNSILTAARQQLEAEQQTPGPFDLARHEASTPLTDDDIRDAVERIKANPYGNPREGDGAEQTTLKSDADWLRADAAEWGEGRTKRAVLSVLDDRAMFGRGLARATAAEAQVKELRAALEQIANGAASPADYARFILDPVNIIRPPSILDSTQGETE